MLGNKRDSRTEIAGHWLVLAAAVLWGTTGTAQAVAPAGAQPLTVGAVRLAIGGAALLALAYLRGALRGGFVLRLTYPVGSTGSPKDGRWPVFSTALAAGSMAAYQVFFFAGVAKTGVAVGTVVTIGSSPMLAGVLGMWVRRERPGRRWGVATALAVLGCSVLMGAGANVSVDAAGVLLALGAGLSYAAYAVSSKGLLEVQSPDAAMAVVFGLGAVLLAPFLVAGDLSWLVQLRGLIVALHLGLIATAAAYLLFSRGLQVVPVATAVTLSLAEPLTAATLGVVWLGERLTLPVVLGVALLLSGLAVLAFSKKNHT